MSASNKYAIEIHDLGKKYHIAKQIDSDATLLSSMINTITTPFRRSRNLLKGELAGASELDREFWALKHIDFNIEQGEVVGIIGRNGAGKSTLLKILSRITEPSEGYARINGRVGSLLEVGTGFHPELTGRENVFLNGSILGMRQAEINQKFDEIVAFSGVEKFIDTPIKHYSSGMTVRLAFAVAAHLEPEILLIDEVLSVGDAEFQKKSLGKMDSISQSGRTIIFVSHSMAAINNLCNRVIWLDHGQIKDIGSPQEIIAKYITDNASGGARANVDVGNPETAIIHELGVQNHTGDFATELSMIDPFYLWIRFSIIQPMSSPQIGFAILSETYGVIVFATTHTDKQSEIETLEQGEYEARVSVPAHFLNRGNYVINARIIGVAGSESRTTHAQASGVIQFSIIDTGSAASKMNDKRLGLITPLLDWEVAQISIHNPA